MERMAAVGHVGNRPAPKVANAEARQFVEQRHAEAQFQRPPQPASACHPQADGECRQHQQQQRGRAGKALATGSEQPTDINQCPKAKNLDDHQQAGEPDGPEQRERREQPVGEQQLQQNRKRALRLFAESRR